jgi:hypothetical protein
VTSSRNSIVVTLGALGRYDEALVEEKVRLEEPLPALGERHPDATTASASIQGHSACMMTSQRQLLTFN